MLQERLSLTERRACRIAGQHRSRKRHRPRRPDRDDALRSRLRELSPLEQRIAERGSIDPAEVDELRRKAREAGFSMLNMPAEVGGKDLSMLGQVALEEESGKATNGLGFAVVDRGPRELYEIATPEQIERYVLPIVRGEYREPLHRAALLLRGRRPDDEVDDRLGDHPEHVHVVGGAVLELLLHREAHRGEVEPDERADAPRLRKGGALVDDRHRGRSCAKTSSMTSSIGGSSMVRSRTDWSARSCAATRGVSAFGTRSVTQSPSTWMTSP
ncbi:MAG: hypothetical protein KatS3mg012_2587 [Gaiellaceae bacterium]|nr:MAG: hypothetical protein KatS3mg012_2587 [Gaiellaceae bacterium]